AARQAGDDFLRRAVRQAAEDHVEPVGLGLLEPDEIGQAVAVEMRKDLRDRLAGAALAGEQADLGVGMADEQPQELRARIAAGAENADANLAVAATHDTSPNEKGRPDRDAPNIEKGRAPVSASRIGSCGAPWRGRISYARRRGCRASGSRRPSASTAGPARRRSAPG